MLLENVPWTARKNGGTELQQCLNLWDIAFGKGMDYAQKNEEQVRKERYEEGHAAGSKCSMEVPVTEVVVDRQKNCEEEGMWGFEVWRLYEEKTKSKKTNVRDLSSTAIAVQTDPPVLHSVAVDTPFPSLSDVATETDTPATAPFDWAEHAQRQRAHGPRAPPPTRDFSSLRSGRAHPSASLHRIVINPQAVPHGTQPYQSYVRLDSSLTMPKTQLLQCEHYSNSPVSSGQPFESQGTPQYHESPFPPINPRACDDVGFIS
ncbi:hypothetical protein R3P38DRAFT_3212825 [Favolaschia claudopus]|uniref:Uncharacterized protein n=1 Tax=Favolaschia claudopus TaxID=2862362 RepID=A0AAW0AEE2_9AGAR